jgi:ribosomal protein S18 acetylase RimI-like enzyme
MAATVRRVRPDEWKLLKEVRLAALADSPGAFGSTHAAEVDRADDFWIERAERSSTSPDQATFLARLDGRVIGLVTAYRIEHAPTSVELMSMWTAPDGRRSGAGRLLVGAVTEWASAGSASDVGLWVMRGNTDAQHFYESLGFAETGEFQPLPSDPCKDEVRMRLELAAP